MPDRRRRFDRMIVNFDPGIGRWLRQQSRRLGVSVTGLLSALVNYARRQGFPDDVVDEARELDAERRKRD